MKTQSTRFLLAIALLFGSTGPNWSADFNKGLDAARRGDFLTALREWTPLAERGDSTAQINLGVMYEDGKGVPQDYKKAVKWYRLAAEQGDSRAQVNLGLMYAKGFGVMLDNVSAYAWLSIATSTGDKDAASNRDIIAKRMTMGDISIAQDLALECIKKNYKEC